MGNTQTKTKTPANLGPLLDQIATKYIITQNYKDLANLEDPAYCNKLIILTSNIFNKFLDKQNVKYLEQRMQQGRLVDNMRRDTLIYLEKDDIAKLDVRNSIQKKRMCIGIAQFYVKVGHIFAAILKTLNPEYVFTGADGIKRRVSLLEKEDIPKYNSQFEGNVNISLVKNIENNLCARRLKALTPKSNRKGKYNIRVCKINRPLAVTQGIPGSMTSSRKFNTEVGIPELRFLYLDQYDYGTGQFTKMTPDSQKEYKKDVALFYKTFTGRSNVPAEVQNFSQIPLGDFHNRSACQTGLLTKAFSYDPTSNLYKAYATHLKNMMNTAVINQNKLIAILNKIFIKKVNAATKKEEYTINPSLTRKSLQSIVIETRKLIIQLYVQCEKDFRAGIKLFEALIEKKEQMRNENRRKYLEKEFNQLLE